ncbi:DUF2306 domain-containing protein [Cognatishimia sp. D5M38]|uniref:DUF2306 domain-containing protein n=1 Tax=Cognatishimia coralii TaxID=3083254 RepID=A0ABU8QFI1_9RHOB
MMMQNTAMRWFLGVLWALTFVVILASLRFAFVALELAQPAMIYHALERPLVFYGHVVGATIALALVPFQFWTRLRMRRLTLHSWLGRLYAVAILLGGISGVWLAMTTQTGSVAGAGFALLGVAWLYVTGNAVRLAMLGDIAAHRRWMIRSAALTLAAVTLRIYLPILAATLGFEAGYTLVAWLCWVPNLLFAEWLLRREGQRRAVPA